MKEKYQFMTDDVWDAFKYSLLSTGQASAVFHIPVQRTIDIPHEVVEPLRLEENIDRTCASDTEGPSEARSSSERSEENGTPE